MTLTHPKRGPNANPDCDPNATTSALIYISETFTRYNFDNRVTPHISEVRSDFCLFGKELEVAQGNRFDPRQWDGWSLYDTGGARKYLTASERRAFLDVAVRAPAKTATFARFLCETGCRLSEALDLRAGRVDLSAKVVVIESLKKRRVGVYRAVPISDAFAEALDRTHELAIFKARSEGSMIRLWPWARMTGYRYVKALMRDAGISGAQASPKGLRHGFAIAALEQGVPLHLVQKWLGHSSLATTAIYGNAVGVEERTIASRMWSK